MTTPHDRDDKVGAVRVTDGRRRGIGRLWPLLAGLLLLVLALVALTQCGADDDDAATRPGDEASGAGNVAGDAADAGESAAGEAAGAGESAADEAAGAAGGAAAGAGAGARGMLTAGGTDLLPLAAAGGSGSELARYSGQQAEGRGVTVESVPADEGFWVGTGAQERVWVQLTGAAGESPFEVEAGDRVSFAGTVTAHPEGFAEEIGVTAEEGADLLQAQGQHIEVPRAELQLDG